MSIKLIHQPIFSGQEKAVLLTVDGAASGMEGNIARAFARRYPECWEELSVDIKYPIPLGQSRCYEIDEGLAEDEHCPYRYAVIASTLHHLDNFDTEQKCQVISRALTSALSLMAQKGTGQLATTVMRGGWRLSEMDALNAMVAAYQVFSHINPHLPTLNIYLLEQAKYQAAIKAFPDLA